MSSDLQWLLLRKANSFIVKRAPEGPVFSTEPGNLTQLHSFKYSGICNERSVDISPSSETSGLTITLRNKDANPRHIKKALTSSRLKSGSAPRRDAKAVASRVAGYRADLRSVALARASAISAAQKQAVNPKAEKAKKTRGTKKAAAPAAEESS